MTQETRTIYTISDLNRKVKHLLQANFPTVWVEGEISNLRAPSTHLYFNLKDEKAQINCALFRLNRSMLKFKPENGLHVVAQAKVSLYEARGDYQLIVEHMELAGEGLLQRAFEALKKKLAAEGLFDTDHKKPIPTVPKTIGIITSPTGAAVRDVLSILKRRFPSIPIIIYPTQVQGEAAIPQIINAIKMASQREECDVLMVTRGGGSIEDLWCFNDEMVARTIFDCQIPVISAVGHEIDFTIADFVADLRAPTPSAAAEMVSPDKFDLLQTLDHLTMRLNRVIQTQLKHYLLDLAHLMKRLQHPKKRLEENKQHLEEFKKHLKSVFITFLYHKEKALASFITQLKQHHPAARIRLYQQTQSDLGHRLITNMNNLIRGYHNKFNNLQTALLTVSPKQTLKRGYAIVRKKDKIIHASKALQLKDAIHVQLHEGNFSAKVTGIIANNDISESHE